MRYLLLLLVGCGFSPTLLGDGGITGEGGSGSGSNTDFQYRKRVTLNVGSPAMLTDFPVSIVTVDAELAKRAPDPGQIAFTDLSGTPLSREIVAYEPSTGALEAWLRIPQVTGSVDVYMVYGPGSPAEPMNVWRGYAAAWHFAELTAPFMDSAGGRTVSPPSPGATPTPTTAGIIGAAQSFDGSDDATSTAHDPTLDFGSGSFTIQAWVNVDTSANGYDEVLFNGGDNGLPGYMLTLGSGSWFAYVSDGIERHTTFGLETALLHRWNQLTAVVDRTANLLSTYVNGGFVSQVSIANLNDVSSTQAFQIGSLNSSYMFEGTVDELRLVRSALGVDWIAAEYRNVSTRSSFVTFAPEETF